MGPDPQGAQDHQHPHQDLGVHNKFPQAPQGPLSRLDSQWDQVGLAHKSQMHSLYIVK